MNLCNEQSETVDHKGPVDTGVVRVLKIIEKYNYCYIYTHWPTLAICIFTHIAWLTIKLTVESYDFNTLHGEAGTGGGREVTVYIPVSPTQFRSLQFHSKFAVLLV